MGSFTAGYELDGRARPTRNVNNIGGRRILIIQTSDFESVFPFVSSTRKYTYNKHRRCGNRDSVGCFSRRSYSDRRNPAGRQVGFGGVVRTRHEFSSHFHHPRSSVVSLSALYHNTVFKEHCRARLASKELGRSLVSAPSHRRPSSGVAAKAFATSDWWTPAKVCSL